jgi:hypothetical protein
VRLPSRNHSLKGKSIPVVSLMLKCERHLIPLAYVLAALLWFQLTFCLWRENAENTQVLNISESFTVISHGNERILITIWFSLTTGRKRDCYANLNNSSL